MSTDSTDTTSAVTLWKSLSDQQRLMAAEAFWRETDSADQQIEAMVLLSQKLKARPKFIATLPIARKAKHLAQLVGMPEAMAARLLVSYHLGHQRPLMAAFLDAAGIPHADGLIDEAMEGPIDAAKLAAGAEALSSAHPEADVRLYFQTLLLQDPDTWGGLQAHL